MIYVLGGGGGIAEAYAAIGVTYPAGSVCTCTKGTKTLTAKDTSGSYLFLIPEAGTWIVSCTDGTDTASESVAITAQYMATTLTLSYSYVLFDRSVNTFNEISAGLTMQSALSVNNYSSTFVEIQGTGTNNNRGSWSVPLPADISGYSRIQIYGYSGVSDTRHKFGVTSAIAADTSDTWIAFAQIPTTADPPTEIPLSADMAGKYFTFRVNGTKTIYISSVKLVK